MIQELIEGGIVDGAIGGLVVALIQTIIYSRVEHSFIIKTKKTERTYEYTQWHRDEIGKLIQDVSSIRVPAITETNEDVILNAYYLIIADFERAKPLLYKKDDCITIKGFFNTLNKRYEQMHDIKLGNEKNLSLKKSKRVLIGEIEECKKRLLNVLQNKEKEIMSKMILLD